MRLILASTLAALSSASSSITAKCEDDNTISVVINHDIEGKILKASYGSCSMSDAGIDGFSGDHNTTWTGTLYPSRCNMDGKLRNLQYNQTAEFTVGREDDGKQLVFTTYDVDTFCEYKNTYTVTFDYGTINADEKIFTGDGGLIGLQFYVESTNEYFNQSQAVSKQAGDTVYLTLQLNDTANGNFNHAENFEATTGKAFLPTKCFVADSGSNKNYTLFDTGATECSNEIIDLVINYDSDAHMWQIQHTLFLLDNEITSTYSLTCDVLVCDMQKGDDCKTAYDCLVPSQETEPACVPMENWGFSWVGESCQDLVEFFAENYPNDDLCSPAHLGSTNYADYNNSDLLWKDVCCPENWEATKHCNF